MRPPMPRPLQSEIDTLYTLLKNAGVSVIEKSEAKLAA